MHLAEFNIAEARYELDDPRMADFVSNIERINGIAERMPGFVWRLKDEPEGAMAAAWDGNTRLVDNLSVWESPETLVDFAFRTVHKQIYERRADWFPLLESHHFVMWWIDPGHTPTREEAQAKLEHLNASGPTPDAFTWDLLDIALPALGS